ncbi:MAG TPA: thiamine phosphate synthase [Candidatus Anaerotruncus excrementipullorum]|uniref:Thiamine-phosphate synthase n=1 Tax=Candidatus Anaerotruncus excrementipullorum TaxID=2838465 RepID=A0A9D1WPW0_9FIRM|nr:thiamine phosphate synthase [Candidatus Anaerotruncus excrementipullorum]
MNWDRKMLRLYLITDRSWLGGRSLEDQVEAALEAGATCLQLREKHLEEEAFLAQAVRIKEIAHRHGVPLIINDNLRVALESGADGLHVGQGDLQAQKARALLGPEKILGVSARTVEQALAAQAAGADYLGVGAVFPTSTKPEAAEVPWETLGEICRAVEIPVVAIGGITAQRLPQLAGSGIAGAAVISAVFAQPDIPAAVRGLLDALERTVAP